MGKPLKGGTRCPQRVAVRSLSRERLDDKTRRLELQRPDAATTHEKVFPTSLCSGSARALPGRRGSFSAAGAGPPRRRVTILSTSLTPSSAADLVDDIRSSGRM